MGRSAPARRINDQPPQKVAAAAQMAPPARAAKAKPAPKKRPQLPPKGKGRGGKPQKTSGKAPSRCLFDPTHTDPVPSDSFQASAVSTSIRGVLNGVVPMQSSLSDVTSGKGWRVLIVSPNSNCNTSAVWISADGIIPDNFAEVQLITPPMLAQSSDYGAPISGRCQKAGVTISNVSNAYQRSGTVYSLSTDRRIAIPGNLMSSGANRTTGPELYNFCQSVIGHPDTITHNASEFTSPKKFYCTPRDCIEYNKFRPWVAPSHDIVTGAFLDTLYRNPPQPTDSAATIELVLHPMVMNALVFVFPPVGMGDISNPLTGALGSPQQYMITSLSQYYTRWPLENPMSTTSKSIPVVDSKALADKTKAGAARGAGKAKGKD